VNNGGGNGPSCGGIKVRMDTKKLSNMAIASFGDGHNLVGEGMIYEFTEFTEFTDASMPSQTILA